MLENEKKKCYAIVLSAGTGSRMGSSVPKQYLPLLDRPVIYYSLKAFEDSPYIDEILLVAGADDLSYVKEEIVDKYGFTKVTAILAGGKERYFSVANALKKFEGKDGYVMIHDGARPMLTEEIIGRLYEGVCTYEAVCAAVPVKDTIKIVDEEGFAVRTPDRKTVYAVQTPQVFSLPLITGAYGELLQNPDTYRNVTVTDDAMVVECVYGKKVKMLQGSYENIKITTPEDMEVAKVYLSK